MADRDVVVFPDILSDVFQLPLHRTLDELTAAKVHNKSIVVELKGICQYLAERMCKKKA